MLRAAAACECRHLYENGFVGTIPTQLGNMDALYQLCVRRPSPTSSGRVRCHRVFG
jgi:hypothetical protein